MGHCRITAESLPNHFRIIVESLPNHCRIIVAKSLLNHCRMTAESLPNHCSHTGIIMHWAQTHEPSFVKTSRSVAPRPRLAMKRRRAFCYNCRKLVSWCSCDEYRPCFDSNPNLWRIYALGRWQDFVMTILYRFRRAAPRFQLPRHDSRYLSIQSRGKPRQLDDSER